MGFFADIREMAGYMRDMAVSWWEYTRGWALTMIAIPDEGASIWQWVRCVLSKLWQPIVYLWLNLLFVIMLALKFIGFAFKHWIISLILIWYVWAVKTNYMGMGKNFKRDIYNLGRDLQDLGLGILQLLLDYWIWIALLIIVPISIGLAIRIIRKRKYERTVQQIIEKHQRDSSDHLMM